MEREREHAAHDCATRESESRALHTYTRLSLSFSFRSDARILGQEARESRLSPDVSVGEAGEGRNEERDEEE